MNRDYKTEQPLCGHSWCGLPEHNLATPVKGSDFRRHRNALKADEPRDLPTRMKHLAADTMLESPMLTLINQAADALNEVKEVVDEMVSRQIALPWSLRLSEILDMLIVVVTPSTFPEASEQKGCS